MNNDILIKFAKALEILARLKRNEDFGEGFYSNTQDIKSVKEWLKKKRSNRSKKNHPK